jgi:hypothetical protein
MQMSADHHVDLSGSAPAARRLSKKDVCMLLNFAGAPGKVRSLPRPVTTMILKPFDVNQPVLDHQREFGRRRITGRQKISLFAMLWPRHKAVRGR